MHYNFQNMPLKL